MKIKLLGSKFNQRKFDKRQKEWIRRGEFHYMCMRHQTHFDPTEEPCWKCWDECEEEIKERKENGKQRS